MRDNLDTVKRASRYLRAIGLLVLCAARSLALNPSPEISQYGHYSWRNTDAFANGAINTIAQTPDGYLWAGHQGLPGMQEPARLVDGKLAVWSELNAGAEIELTISAAIGYAKSPAARYAGPKT